MMSRAPATARRTPPRRGRWLAITLLGGVCLLGWALPRAAQWLVADDAFAHADVALVLSGAPTARVLAARDLYRQGRVERILIVPEPPDPLRGELIKLGLATAQSANPAERILLASGVPASQIAFLPEPVDGTILEARRVRRFLAGRYPPRLVLVTSPASSRRARCIFRWVFRREPVRVLSHPTSYDAFETRRWWAQPRNALAVVTEYEKFLTNLLTLMLSRDRES